MRLQSECGLSLSQEVIMAQEGFLLAVQTIILPIIGHLLCSHKAIGFVEPQDDVLLKE